MAHAADDLAAVLLHHLGHVALQGVAEGVVGGEHEPGIAALLHHRLGGAVGQRVGVIDPVDVVRRAVLVGDAGGGGTGDDAQAVVLLDHLGGGDGDRGGHQAGDQVDVAGIEPLAHGVGTHVGAVAVIGAEHLDGGAVDLAAEVLDGHLQGREAAGTGEVTVGAGHVGEVADAHGIVAHLGLGAAGHQGGGGQGNTGGECLAMEAHG